MPPRLRGEVRAIHEATQTLDQGQVTVDGDALLRLARACRDLVRVRFDYEARDGTPSSRTVEPVGLVATGRRWYLMAYDVDREDWRTFRLDRLRAVEPTTWRFREREHEDPAAFVQRGVASAAYRFQARVARARARWPRSPSGPACGLGRADRGRRRHHPARGRLRDPLRAGLPPHRSWAGSSRCRSRPSCATALAEMGGRALRAAGRAAERHHVGSCHGWVLVAVVVLVAAALRGRSADATRQLKQQRAVAELEPVKKLAFEDVTALGVELQDLDLELAGKPLDVGANADYQRALDSLRGRQDRGRRDRAPRAGAGRHQDPRRRPLRDRLRAGPGGRRPAARSAARRASSTRGTGCRSPT